MALKRMTTEEMAQVSRPWVATDSPARKALHSVPALKGLVDHIDKAHKALHEAQPGVAKKRINEISAEAAAVDGEHDALIRGTHTFLGAYAMLAEGTSEADMYTGLCDLLLPEGLEHTQKTYRGEAGAAELLKTRIDSDANVKKQLKEILGPGKKPIGHFVNAWIEKARRLGELEDERVSLATLGEGTGTKQAAARNGWIRAVNALVAVAELSKLDEETDHLIFGALRLAEKHADNRGRGGGGGTAEPTGGGPTE